MKKYCEIQTASEEFDESFDPDENERVKSTLKLEEQGHKVIAIGRALAIVEQCEPDDNFPKGSCSVPLKITFRGDFEGCESSLFLQAGQYGFMEIFGRVGNNLKKFVPIDSEMAKTFSSIDQAEGAQTISELMEFYLQPGLRRRNPLGFSALEEDALLEQYANEAKANFRSYLRRLAELRSAEDNTS
jgi:hypothetical protein